MMKARKVALGLALAASMAAPQVMAGGPTVGGVSTSLSVQIQRDIFVTTVVVNDNGVITTIELPAGLQLPNGGTISSTFVANLLSRYGN